jgi:thiol-disulfide isomerase/thioredoxin
VPTLLIGDPAPPLTIEAWLRGEPVERFEAGKVYIVEFWATWCIPCLRNIPHLAALQKRYADRGLTVIGVASDQPGGVAEVREFLSAPGRGGEAMTYTVAWDKDRATDRAWRQAAGFTMIPTAFVVDKEGLVAWAGHPGTGADEMERTLEGVIAGTFDTRAVGVVVRKAQQILARANAAWNAERRRQALEILDELVALDRTRYVEAARTKLSALLLQLGDVEAAAAYGARLIDEVYRDDPAVIASIARLLLESPAQDRRLQDLALRGAARAAELAGPGDVALLESLAQVHFLRGDFDKAIEMQSKALSAAGESARLDSTRRLEEYRRAAEAARRKP